MSHNKICQKIDKIIEKYDSNSEFFISNAYDDGGASNPAPRLHRAAINQIEGVDGATLSRYAIWANTIRDNIIKAAELINSDPHQPTKLLKVAANSLSAFSDIQECFDPLKNRE